jgi:heme/copper-type cytochrome/quinol oxidase subunit 3
MSNKRSPSTKIDMDEYLRLDAKWVKDRRFHHYYNEIPYTRWPFAISACLFNMMFCAVLYIHKFEGYKYELRWGDNLIWYVTPGFFTVVSLILIGIYMYLWFKDMITEAVVFGKYNRKLRAVITTGFLIFLASEAMLFGGFFRAFFDRLFHAPSVLGGSFVPRGLEVLLWYKKPLYATLVLMFSTVAFNGANYAMKWGSWTRAKACSQFGLALGCLFLVIQVSEYKHLSFGMSDSVFASCFYLLTGFHGMHVMIGLMFLAIQHERLVSWHFSRERHLGYILGMMYWHFVDIVWMFLFLFVYVLGNAGRGFVPVLPNYS